MLFLREVRINHQFRKCNNLCSPFRRSINKINCTLQISLLRISHTHLNKRNSCLCPLLHELKKNKQLYKTDGEKRKSYPAICSAHSGRGKSRPRCTTFTVTFFAPKASTSSLVAFSTSNILHEKI